MYIDKLKRIESLPVLPEVTVRIQRLLSSDDGSARDLEELISQDLSLMSSILRVANSALYNYSGRKITSLRDAIVRIGRSELQKILLGVSVFQTLPGCEVLDMTLLWQKSFVSSALAEKLIRESSLQFAHGNDLKMAAMLHNIGYLILGVYFPSHIRLIDSEMRLKDYSFSDGENSLFKTDLHAELASALLELWRFPVSITIPARYHESPGRSPDTFRRESFLINCVDALIQLVLPCSFDTRYTEDQVATILTQNGINENTLPDLIDFISLEADKALTQLSLWGMGESYSKLRATGSTLLLRPV